MADPARLYETDFYAWTQDQGAKLRAWPEHLRPNGIDIANIAEEIESLGRSDVREIESRLLHLIVHLLKLAYSPAEAPRRGWRSEVIEVRHRLTRLLRDSPSLAPRFSTIAAEEWPVARERALADLERDGVTEADIPAAPPPFPLDATTLLDPGWLPPNRHGLKPP
jgi:Domain of unknown function DUF29